MRSKAVCLFSGGLDSATCLYHAKSVGFEPIALTIHYGQIHQREIEMSRMICTELSVRQHEIQINLPWKGSALLDREIGIPTKRSFKDMDSDIPVTYVPARNSIFLSLAASCSEALGAGTIFIGVNALDYSGYPDCRPEFIEAFEAMLARGTREGVQGRSIRIETPLIQLTKKEIIQMAVKLHVPLHRTWSCYQGNAQPCQECDACLLRAKGFQEAGVSDPLLEE